LFNSKSVEASTEKSTETSTEKSTDKSTDTGVANDYDYSEIQNVIDDVMGGENTFDFNDYINKLVSGEEPFSISAISNKLVKSVVDEIKANLGTFSNLITIALLAAVQSLSDC
jgi:hypothetical protein